MSETLNILVAIPTLSSGLQKLSNMRGVNFDVIDYLEDSRPVDKNILRDKHVIACSMLPDNFHAMESLKWIQLDSAGYSQLIPLRLPDCGIKATNGLGNFDIPIAEWNIAMMINLTRDLRGLIRNQEQGIWDRDIRFQSEIRGKTVGLWGYGGIGREIARIAEAMGLNVHVLTRHGLSQRDLAYCVPGTGDPLGILPDRSFTMEQIDDFLGGLDYLILAMPLTKLTEGIVGEEELRKLPSHAFVLNPARGPLIQEEALLRALKEEWIAGAALDTHYYYPMPPEHPLWSMPNVILTPHISGSTGSPRFLERIWDIFLKNVDCFMTGRPFINELSPEQLNGF